MPLFHSTSTIRGACALAACGAVQFFSSLHAAPAEREVQPPFGLAWGETALQLEEALLAANAQVVERKKASGGGETWQVAGLRQIALQRVAFHLRGGNLAGVELQYGKADWTPANYDSFMQSIRQRLEEKHGPGKLVARKQDSERGILQTLLGYRWELSGGAIEIMYFAAQNPANLFRTVSLHYSAK